MAAYHLQFMMLFRKLKDLILSFFLFLILSFQKILGNPTARKSSTRRSTPARKLVHSAVTTPSRLSGPSASTPVRLRIFNPHFRNSQIFPNDSLSFRVQRKILNRLRRSGGSPAGASFPELFSLVNDRKSEYVSRRSLHNYLRNNPNIGLSFYSDSIPKYCFFPSQSIVSPALADKTSF